jgi:hypothetical protein
VVSLSRRQPRQIVKARCADLDATTPAVGMGMKTRMIAMILKSRHERGAGIAKHNQQGLPLRPTRIAAHREYKICAVAGGAYRAPLPARANGEGAGENRRVAAWEVGRLPSRIRGNCLSLPQQPSHPHPGNLTNKESFEMIFYFCASIMSRRQIHNGS